MYRIIKPLLLILFVFLAWQTKAQISIQYTITNGMQFSSDDALSAIITSNIASTVNVYARVTIAREDGLQVSQIMTNPFQLSPGAFVLNKSSVTVRSKKYFNQDLSNYENTNGYLPSGGYTCCMVIVCADDACLQTQVGEMGEQYRYSCTEVSGINPSPLLLASPGDDDTIYELRPNFTWIPPMPIGADPSLTYTFKLVELREKQSGETGIRRNPPLYTGDQIAGTALAFPPELDDLKIGSKYAWQVNAVLGRTIIQTSDVWEFIIDEQKEEVSPMPFVRLRQTDEHTYNAVNELNFVYNNEKSPGNLKYEILTLTGERLNILLPVIALNRGENIITLDLNQLGLNHKQSYILVATGNDHITYTLKFRYYYRKK